MDEKKKRGRPRKNIEKIQNNNIPETIKEKKEKPEDEKIDLNNLINQLAQEIEKDKKDKQPEEIKPIELNKPVEEVKEKKKRGRKKKEKVPVIEQTDITPPKIVNPQEKEEIKEEKKEEVKEEIKENNEENKKKKLKRSEFFITINSNKSFNPYSKECEEFKNKFRKCINDLYDNLSKFVVFKHGGEFTTEYIKSVEVENVCEVGNKKNCVHIHSLLKIAHYSLIQLDYKYMSEFVKKEMNLSGIYINNINAHSNSHLNIIQYMKKTLNPDYDE